LVQFFTRFFSLKKAQLQLLGRHALPCVLRYYAW
jgi:hypothetical protein